MAWYHYGEPYLRSERVHPFWSKVDKTDTCWLWTGGVDDNGYGTYGWRKAHRVAYEELVGKISEETLDHLCRVKKCVRPDHLEPVSRAENTRRGSINTDKPRCKRGHEFDAVNTYYLKNGWRACRACKREAQRSYKARRQSHVLPR